MDWERVAQALGGPELVKLVLASILIVAFIFWQRKEAEGVMRGYVAVAGFALARDILFLLFPQPELYRASDLLLLALVALVFGLPLGGGALLYAAVSVAGLAGLFAWVFGYLRITAFPPGLFLVAGLAPVAIMFLYGTGKSDVAEGQARKLIRKVRYPLALASLAYLVAEFVLGPGDFWFQSAAVPFYYAAISLVGFVFVDVLRDELISAVEYYEESVDSLFELLSATGSVIKAGFSLQEVLDGMIGVMVSKTGADGGVVLLAEEDEEVVAVRALQGRFPPPFKLPESLPKDEEGVSAHIRHARFRIGEGFFGELARDGGAVLIADADADPRVSRNGGEEWLRLRSLMVAPLIARDRTIGLIAVSRVGSEPFGERDFDRLKLIASFGALTVSDAFTFLEAAERSDIDRETAIALEIQRTVVPRTLPELPGYSLGVSSMPARGVCSDYYDVIRIRADRSLVAFGDVAGKGISAGLVMVMVRSILHLIANSTKDCATLLNWVNRGLSGKIDMDHFSTLGLLILGGPDGDIEYAAAAHQPLLIYRRQSQSLETVDIKSIPIGVEKSTEYGARKLKLRAGDILVLYSDGVVEAMNEQGRQYGRKNLGDALLSMRDRGAKEIAEAIRADVDDYSGRVRRHDDQTVFVIKAQNL